MLREVGRIGLGPAGGIGFQNGDGEFGARLAMRREQAAGIGDGRLRRRPWRKCPRRSACFFRPDCATRATARARSAGVASAVFSKIARDLGVFLRAGHGQQVGILRLAARQRLARLRRRARSDSSSVLLVVARAVRPSKNGAHGNSERLLGDILVNGVVGEARERVRRRRRFPLRFRPRR